MRPSVIGSFVGPISGMEAYGQFWLKHRFYYRQRSSSTSSLVSTYMSDRLAMTGVVILDVRVMQLITVRIGTRGFEFHL